MDARQGLMPYSRRIDNGRDDTTALKGLMQ
jgi:hypothetical protein